MATANFVKAGRKIIAYGRTYADHAKELKSAIPKSPFFFLKPTSSYALNGEAVEIPTGVLLHHEVELGVVIGKEGRDIEVADAKRFVGGYALAIDMTARNIQNGVIKKGLPWSTAKGFDTFTPISSFIEATKIPNPQNVDLWLKVNNSLRQNGNTKDMIFSVSELISHVSTIMRLEPGDLILTGTPAGVGPCEEGDNITAGLRYNGEELVNLNMKCVARRGLYRFKED